MARVRRAELRRMLDKGETILAPGAYDCLTAKVIERAGFSALYMTGYGTAASRLGRPDVGLLTMSEMVENARRIAEAVQIPLIADADTGYGNPVNVRRTVQEYERAGVAAIHIEDQVWPKRCGHMEGKRVIPMEEMVQKVRAAVEAREDTDFLIIARTDARAVHGLKEAIARGQAYAHAGADLLFIEAPQSAEEVRVIARSFQVPLLYNYSASGRTPLLPLEELEALGFRIIIFPTQALYTAYKAVMELMEAIRRGIPAQALMERMPSFQEFNAFIGLPEIEVLENRYAVGEA